MNGTRIMHMLSLDPRTVDIFKGLGCPDLPLPIIDSFPALVILNTAPAVSPGEHWCVVCFQNIKQCYFFDPYGKHPKHYKLDWVIKTQCEHLTWNSKVVQGNLAKTCGHHCIYFCRNYAYGSPPKLILKTYSDNLRSNDNMVYDYIRHHYGDIIAAIRV